MKRGFVSSAAQMPRKHDSTERDVISCFRVFVAGFMSLRIAVIGVGHLGRHHARILATLPGADLVAVVDTNRARADEIAAASGTVARYDARELLGLVDAVTLAVPTELHCEIALPFLQ